MSGWILAGFLLLYFLYEYFHKDKPKEKDVLDIEEYKIKGQWER